MDEREEDTHVLNEAKTKLDAATRDCNSITEKARRVDIGDSRYDDYLVKILAYENLIKKLEQEIRDAQEILDK